MTVSTSDSGIADIVSPHAIREWLAAQQWSLAVERPGVMEMWSSVVPRTRGIDSITLPLDDTFADYRRRLQEAIDDLSAAYEMPAVNLIEQIAAARSDMFFVRLDQYSSDGTIPFQQAASLMSSIQKMVRAAATTASNPEHSHRGRRPAQVTEFLEDDLRFGHTKRGSFIITVAARLDIDQPVANWSEFTTLAGNPDSVSASSEISPPEVGPVPFSRQVMTTLAASLALTKQIASEGPVAERLNDLGDRLLSVELLQSIVEIGEADGLRSVDLAMDWAAFGPPPPRIDPVTIVADDFARVADIRDKMLKSEVPTEVTLMGRVAELGRAELGGGAEDHWIILEAELYGRMRRVKVPLLESDYQWAIYAHQNRLPFTATGTAEKHRSWELVGPVVADTAFLRSQRV